MIQGTTESGFTFKIEDKAVDNYELLEALSKAESNPLQVPRIVDMLLGEEQAKELAEHCREDGIVKLSKISKELEEILSASETTKK